MSLFDASPLGDAPLNVKRPLADRMRPETLDDFAGQEHILGPGKPLRSQIERDQLTSIILWGPPGVGKTTLAQHHRPHDEERISALQRGARRNQRNQSGDGGCRASAQTRPPHHPLHRRNSSLQQSSAGCLSAVRGARRHHSDRRHYGKSFVRNQRRAAVALEGLHAARAHHGRDRRAAAARAAGGGSCGYG